MSQRSNLSAGTTFRWPIWMSFCTKAPTNCCFVLGMYCSGVDWSPVLTVIWDVLLSDTSKPYCNECATSRLVNFLESLIWAPYASFSTVLSRVLSRLGRTRSWNVTWLILACWYQTLDSTWSNMTWGARWMWSIDNLDRSIWSSPKSWSIVKLGPRPIMSTTPNAFKLLVLIFFCEFSRVSNSSLAPSTFLRTLPIR